MMFTPTFQFDFSFFRLSPPKKTTSPFWQLHIAAFAWGPTVQRAAGLAVSPFKWPGESSFFD
jgi:hypothetical protein